MWDDIVKDTMTKSTLTRTVPKRMKATDLIDFLIEEAHHHVINVERTKNSDHALAANMRKAKGKSKARKAKDKPKSNESDEVCENCKKAGHKISDCWSKGGGKEGQGPG